LALFNKRRKYGINSGSRKEDKMSPTRDSHGRIFWGLLLIVIGFIFLLGKMGRADVGEIFSHWWPLILIAIGLWSLVTDRSTGGVVLIVIGGFFLLARLHVFGHDLWYYFWPIIIIAIGLWLIVKPSFRHNSRKVPEIKEDDLNASTVLSGLKRNIESKNFRGGKATAIFGGMELDFSNAGLASNQATVDLTAVFGGITLRVPREWQVVLEGTPILGAIEDKHRFIPKGEEKIILYVKGSAIFGGIEIKD